MIGRSQSVGPVSVNTDGSPKRQIRSGSAVPAVSTTTTTANASTAAASKPQKKVQASTPTIVERRPRPSKKTFAYFI